MPPGRDDADLPIALVQHVAAVDGKGAGPALHLATPGPADLDRLDRARLPEADVRTHAGRAEAATTCRPPSRRRCWRRRRARPAPSRSRTDADAQARSIRRCARASGARRARRRRSGDGWTRDECRAAGGHLIRPPARGWFSRRGTAAVPSLTARCPRATRALRARLRSHPARG